MKKYNKAILFFFLAGSFFANANKKVYINLPEIQLTNPYYDRDEICKPFCDLRQALRKLGYDLKPLFLPLPEPLEDCAGVFFINPPDRHSALSCLPKEKLVYSVWEPPTLNPHFYRDNYRQYYGKALVMTDDLVDNNFYFKFFYPQPRLEIETEILDFSIKKLCTLIVGNKSSSHPLELYSKRKEVIDFFERMENGSDYFDFYSNMAWSSRYKNFKGPIEHKRPILKNYRFCICYENSRDLNGYITEKIFDCFVSGCVPIYWGAGNITDYVPKGEKVVLNRIPVSLMLAANHKRAYIFHLGHNKD